MQKKKSQFEDNVVTIHILNCKSPHCHVKTKKLSQDSFCQDIQNICNYLIEQKSKQSQNNQIIYQMWKFQTGNKYKFRMQNKNINIFHQYIIFTALNISKLNQISDNINTENIKSLKNLFYDKFQNILLSFSIFYGQIAKTQPKLQTILSLGNDIKYKTKQIKNMYNQLLKHNAINFKTAQLFVQFENIFMKQTNNMLNYKSIDRMKKIQKNKDSQMIDQIYLPTISFYSDTGLVENMNTQCLAFFKLSRFQIKSKKLGELIYPEILSINQIKENLKKLKYIKGYTFFIKGGQQLCFGSLSIKQKYIQNKKFDIVTIQKDTYSDFKNIILLNKDSKDIVCLIKQQSSIKLGPTSNFITIRWRNLFEKYLASKMQQLIKQKVIKLRIQQYQNSLFVLNFCQSIHSNYYLINIKFIKDLQKKKNRLSSYLVKQQLSANNNNKNIKKFYFNFDLTNSQGALIIGDKGSLKSQQYRQTTLSKLEKQLNKKVVLSTLFRQDRYLKGIKTYRLRNGDLYNIDLQDKQGYTQLFHGQQTNKKDDNTKTSQKDLYLFSTILIITLTIICLSIYTKIYTNNIKSQFTPLYQKSLKIQQFKLYTNRLVSILRDVRDQRYNNNNWKQDLLITYYKLKQIRQKQSLFNNSIKTIIKYRNLTYSGTLNQIFDVLLSHTYTFTQQQDKQKLFEEIKYYQDTYILSMNLQIVYQMFNNTEKMVNYKKQYYQMDYKLVIVTTIIILVFYILLICLIIILNNQTKKKLNKLMMMSDSQSRMNQGLADKLMYALDMVRKNFDVDLKAILGPTEKHKQRKKPKQIILGIQKKTAIFILILIGFGLHTAIILSNYRQMIYALQKMLHIREQGQNILQTYSMFIGVTNRMYHRNSIQIPSIQKLRDKMKFLSQYRGKFGFDQQTNQLIDYVFYKSSCPYLQKIGIFNNNSSSSLNCEKCLPGYIVSNPFILGLISYFSRSHYMILDNITQNFGVTGIYSQPFINIFARIAQKIKNYGILYMNNQFSYLLIWNIVCIILGVVYFIITFVIFFMLKNRTVEISQLLKFLNYTNITDQNQKQQKNKKQQKQKQNNSQTASTQILSQFHIDKDNQKDHQQSDILIDQKKQK